jgi:uncharacterized protein YegP (UPF0339 family)
MIIEIEKRFSLKHLRGEWYFRVKGNNGEILVHGGGYKNRIECIATVDLLRTEMYDTDIVYL